MPVKVRLARHGRKRLPFYHIVVADSRAPRDGKFIERIGSYSPTTIPATIDLDFDKALDWLNKGAKPTDTVRAIFSQEGVLMKKHLLEGVKKGAFDEAEAERRYDIWKKDKELKLKAAQDKVDAVKAEGAKARLDAEAKVNEERAKEIAERVAKVEAERKAAEEAAKAEAEAEAAAQEAEENTEEAPAEEETEAKEEASEEETNE
jgi:small subunit ribosomal protein S16